MRFDAVKRRHLFITSTGTECATVARWVFVSIVLVVFAASTSGCSEPETKLPATRLVYLTNQPVCAVAQPECEAQRQAAAKAVLRLPAHFGASDKNSPPFYSLAPVHITSGEIFVLPGDRIVSFDDKDVDYRALVKESLKNFARFDRNKPAYLQSIHISWGDIGRADELSRRLDQGSYGKYVEVEPIFPGWKTFDLGRCVGHAAVFQGRRGKVSPDSPCDFRTQYLQPASRPDVYLSCGGQLLVNGKLEIGACTVLSTFTLRTVGGRPFPVNYAFAIPAGASDWIKGGHWEYLDTRLRDWIGAADVTDQELQAKSKQ